MAKASCNDVASAKGGKTLSCQVSHEAEINVEVNFNKRYMEEEIDRT